MITKEDWHVVEKMPEENIQFHLDWKLNDEQIQLLKTGFKPESMEDEWFIYYEDNTLNFHRSWTGYCIFKVEIKEDGLDVTVNRNPDQYKETVQANDELRIEMLIKDTMGWITRDVDEMIPLLINQLDLVDHGHIFSLENLVGRVYGPLRRSDETFDYFDRKRFEKKDYPLLQLTLKAKLNEKGWDILKEKDELILMKEGLS